MAAAHALHTPAVPDKARVSLSFCYGEFVLEESLIRLLRAVESARSLRAACAELPMSYSRAWVLLGERSGRWACRCSFESSAARPAAGAN